MYVRNVAGYNFAFNYRDSVIYIPYDGKIYSIPDDSGRYRELKVVPAMHIRSQNVTYINKDGSIASEKLSGHKRRGRPPKVVDPDKPLKGVKIKQNAPVNNKEKPKPPIDDNVDNSVMDIDLDKELTNDVKDVSKDEPLVVDKSVESKQKTTTTRKKATTTKKKATSTGKKRGRPSKKS